MKFIPLCLSVLLTCGCVSNRAVQTVQPDDYTKSCAALQDELKQLGATFEQAKEDSGISVKNAGMALVFWQGIIVNELRSNKNQDSNDPLGCAVQRKMFRPTPRGLTDLE